MTDQTRVGSPEAEPDRDRTQDAPEGDTPGTTAETTDDAATTTGTAAEDGEAEDATGRRGRRARRRAAAAEAAADGTTDDSAPDDEGDDAGPARRRRAALPLVPVLAVLLVLLLAGTGFLWATRPASSAVSTGDYVDALQAARAGIVDVTSFDYLTLDDDINQIEAVTTGDLTQESVDRLNGSRQALTDAQAVVNTEVVGAAVGAADAGTATVFMVIQSTQTSSASQQAQVQRYRIEVDLTKDGGRWLLSGISGR